MEVTFYFYPKISEGCPMCMSDRFVPGVSASWVAYNRLKLGKHLSLMTNLIRRVMMPVSTNRSTVKASIMNSARPKG